MKEKITKPIIYQLFPRWMTNSRDKNVPNGTMEQNGVGKFNEINETVLKGIKDLGITHVWYTGVIEHASKTAHAGIKPSSPAIVKGNAGSPYAIRDYYDVDPDLAEHIGQRMEEFEALVKRTHEAGMKVIIDFVPNHVAREYQSDAKPHGVSDLGDGDQTGMFFEPNNNFYYITGQPFAPQGIDLGGYREFPAKATGNDGFHASPSASDWYETVKLNYGIDPWNGSKHFHPIPDTWKKMLNILLFWASKGIDGFRCDMAHMVPVAFWHWAIAEVKTAYPGLQFIAEIYDTGLYWSYIYDGGFDYLYDKVTLYDTLCNILVGKQAAADITNCWKAVDGIREHMLNFLENHDEPRIASRVKAGNAASVFPALVVSATLSTGPFMIYAGQELGEKAEGAMGFSGDDGRTSIFDYCSVPTIRRWYNGGKCNLQRLTAEEKTLRKQYRQVLRLCNHEPAIARGKMFDLMYVNGSNVDPQKHYIYLRACGDQALLIGANFDGKPCTIDIHLPQHAFDFLELKSGPSRLLNLLDGEAHTAYLSPSRKLRIDIKAHDAVILSIEYLNEQKVEK